MHTLAQPARTGRAHCVQVGRVAAVSWHAGYRIAGLASAVSQAWLAVSCIVSSRRVSCRGPSVSYHGAPCAVSCLSHDITHRPSHALYRDPQGCPPATIKLCIATPPSQAMRARATARPVRWSAISWPSDGCIVAQPTVSWATMRAPVVCPGQPPQLCVMIQIDVS